MFLDTVTAKKILAISGHSSLSLHAPIIHLVDGPAICLAIEGNAHTIMRLRALTVDTKNFGEGSSNRCLWKLQSGEWGVIASSSVRLARELILFCFNCLHGALKISKQGNENITACRTTAQSVSSLK